MAGGERKIRARKKLREVVRAFNQERFLPKDKGWVLVEAPGFLAGALGPQERRND
jgi:hypothetical protein